MRRLTVVAAALALEACDRADDPPRDWEPPTYSAVVPDAVETPPIEAAQPEPLAEMQAEEELEPIPTCFGDYCPCDRSDPDYGGADVPACRSLEQGVPVSDELMAAAAGLRDARRQLREFEEQEGGF